jgi:hypothetical protein
VGGVVFVTLGGVKRRLCVARRPFGKDFTQRFCGRKQAGDTMAPVKKARKTTESDPRGAGLSQPQY